jgi:hypothetical protein
MVIVYIIIKLKSRRAHGAVSSEVKRSSRSVRLQSAQTIKPLHMFIHRICFADIRFRLAMIAARPGSVASIVICISSVVMK